MPDPALDATIDQARELPADPEPITLRRMFGGAGSYPDGTIFCPTPEEEISPEATEALR